MSGRAMAAWLPESDVTLPILAWVGVVMLGMAVLMTLLDWGELSGLAPGPPPRRRLALVLAVLGLVLLVVGGIGTLLVT